MNEDGERNEPNRESSEADSAPPSALQRPVPKWAVLLVFVAVGWGLFKFYRYQQHVIYLRMVEVGWIRLQEQGSSPGVPPAKPAATFDHHEDSCIIPWDEVGTGGPPKDGIPSISDPNFVAAAEVDFLSQSDRVVGVAIGGESRAYPLRILDWHEAVNDTVGGRPILVTYCPLCDSAFVFDREIGGEIREFGISGLLYNSNVLLYDRQETDEEESLWSQLLLGAVCGPAAEAGLTLELVDAEFATWGRWLEAYPDSQILSRDTGHFRRYERNGYGDYFAHDGLMFSVHMPPADTSPKFRNKERIAVVSVDGRLKAYPYSRLTEAAAAGSANDVFEGVELLFALPDAEAETIEVEFDESAEADVAVAYSFWFAFVAMHPDAEVFGEPADTTASSAGTN